MEVVNFWPSREDDGVGGEAEKVNERVDDGVRVIKECQRSSRTTKEGA
jgi:hypothetical protein